MQLNDQAPTSIDVKWVKDEVAAIHERNRQRGHADWCGHDFDFTCPSSVTYPFQWFWDSCFHAIALSHVDLQKAEAEIKSLLGASPAATRVSNLCSSAVILLNSIWSACF